MAKFEVGDEVLVRAKVLKADGFLMVEIGDNQNSPQFRIAVDRTLVQPIQTYTVMEGDTLTEIAEKVLGNWKAWPLLVQANNLEDPNMIHAGQVLRLP